MSTTTQKRTKTRRPAKARSSSRSSSKTTRRRTSSTKPRSTGSTHRNQHLSHTTTDHDEIRTWAEARGAHPAAVRRTESNDDVGVIRLDFPGFSGRGSLEEISWDEFFDKFDQAGLALVYQDKTSGGKKSNFNKLVKR